MPSPASLNLPPPVYRPRRYTDWLAWAAGRPAALPDRAVAATPQAEPEAAVALPLSADPAGEPDVNPAGEPDIAPAGQPRDARRSGKTRLMK